MSITKHPVAHYLAMVENDGSAEAPPSDDYEPYDADDPRTPPPAEPTAFETRWVTLGDCPNVLIDTPAPQKWLFTRYQDGRDVGVFPRGKTGLFTGSGGTGKTYALLQLALAVAGGGFWLETFRVAEPGHVLLALAEEELAECTRRLWRACNSLELSVDQRKDVAQRIHLLPLHGIPVSLLCSPAPNAYAITQAATELRKRLETFGVDWSALILDPLSRWSGAGAERDNEAATRFIQVVEGLTTVRGNPGVILAHHSSKASVGTGTADARGVSGLRDAVRWMASFDALKSDDGERAVRLRNDKSNYSPEFEDLILLRNSEPGTEGTLRLASTVEAEPFGGNPAGREKAKQAKAKTAFGTNCDLVLAQLPLAPQHTTLTAIEAGLRAAGTGLSDKTLKLILERLASSAGGGRAVDLSGGAQAKARQWARTSEAL